MPEDKADNRILKVCKGLCENQEGNQEIILVTKDLVLRLKAQIMGIKAEDFTTEQITEEDALYTGRCEAYIPEELVKVFKKKGISVTELYQSDEEGNHYPVQLEENELSDKIVEVFDRGIIQTEALNFIRGRSIAKTYLIIDEAQNMTPNQVKGIITRAGKDTKIILLGDPNQIDKPFLDQRTNGLSYAAKYMKGSPLCWQITLSAEECERSVLAMDAVKRL